MVPIVSASGRFYCIHKIRTFVFINLYLSRNSPEGRCIVNVAIRFKLEELNPAGKAQKLIVDGSISGMPVDSDYFVVFCKYMLFDEVNF